MLFSYHLLYFCTALSLIIMLSSHYHHHKSKTFSQLTQCPFTGTLLLFMFFSCFILPKLNFHISCNRYGLMEFFDHKDNWADSSVAIGKCCNIADKNVFFVKLFFLNLNINSINMAKTKILTPKMSKQLCDCV